MIKNFSCLIIVFLSFLAALSSQDTPPKKTSTSNTGGNATTSSGQQIGESLNQEFTVSFKTGKLTSSGTDKKKNLPFDVPFTLVGKVPEEVIAIEVQYIKRNCLREGYFTRQVRSQNILTFNKCNASKLGSATWFQPALPLLASEKGPEGQSQSEINFHLYIKPLNPNTEYVFQFNLIYKDIRVEEVKNIVKEKLLESLFSPSSGFLLDALYTVRGWIDKKKTTELAQYMLDKMESSGVRLRQGPRVDKAILGVIKDFIEEEKDTFSIATFAEYKTRRDQDNGNEFINSIKKYLQVPKVNPSKLDSTLLDFFQRYIKPKDSYEVMDNLSADILQEFFNEIFKDLDLKRKIDKLYYRAATDDITLSNSYSYINKLPEILTRNSTYKLGVPGYFNDLLNVIEYFRSYNSCDSTGMCESFKVLVDSDEMTTLQNDSNSNQVVKDIVRTLTLPKYFGEELIELNMLGYYYSNNVYQAVLEGQYQVTESSFQKMPLQKIDYIKLTEKSIDAYVENLVLLDGSLQILIEELRKIPSDDDLHLTALKVLEKLYPLSGHVKTNLQLYDDIKSYLRRIEQKIGVGIAEATIDVKEKIKTGVSSHSIGNFKTRAEWYVSGDIGVASVFFGDGFIPEYRLQPYFGVNFNLAPVNRQRHFNLFKDIGSGGGKRPLRNLSIILGLTIDGFNNIGEDSKLQNLWGNNLNLLTGLGIRLFDPVRINGGVIWIRQENANPILSTSSTEVFPFLSVSYDIDVAQQLKNVGRLFKAN